MTKFADVNNSRQNSLKRCELLHYMLNKLTVIVGQCDPQMLRMKPFMDFATIQKTATEMARLIVQYFGKGIVASVTSDNSLQLSTHYETPKTREDSGLRRVILTPSITK